MNEKVKTGKNVRKNGAIAGRSAALLAGTVLVALLCCYGVYSIFTGMILQSQIRVIQEKGTQNRLWAQTALEDPETALENWGNLVRNGNHTDIEELLDATDQGNQLLCSQSLFLVDGDSFFYGSNGIIAQMPEYESFLNRMESDTQTFYDNANGAPRLLICVKLKPFTVDDETFLYAMAEFSPDAIFKAFLTNAHDRQMAVCILDGNGKTVAKTGGDSIFGQLGRAKLNGYPSVDLLKRAALEQERLCTVCTTENKGMVLASEKMGGRDWVVLTLCPLDAAFSLPGVFLAIPLVLTLLLIAAAGWGTFLLLRLRVQRQRTKAAEASTQALEEALKTAQETNRSQMALMNRISHDIRTPLNVILGYTALANRHIQEPEMICRYLEKITESSAQLLARSDEGLETERTVEDTTPLETEGKPINLEGKRVLLVEDNRLNREIATEILGEAGMLVESACNGQEGFQKLALSQPGYFDVILMDIQMPVMDGCEATRTIRRLRSKMLAEIPIIAMTASVSDEDKRNAFQAGMDSYVEKPINIGKLLNTIKNVLRRS